MKKLFFDNSSRTGRNLAGITLGITGLLLSEYLGFKFLIPRFIGADDMFLKIILLTIPIIVFFVYFFVFAFVIISLQEGRKDIDNDRDFCYSFVILFCAILGIVLYDYNFDQNRIEESHFIEQEIVQNFSDYSIIPDSLFKEAKTANLLITFEKTENGIILNRRLNSKYGKSNNLFFIEPDLSYKEITPYSSPKKVDKYIQEEIIQKFTDYDKIQGVYYSPVGDVYLDVEEYGDNKVLTMRGWRNKYIVIKKY